MKEKNKMLLLDKLKEFFGTFKTHKEIKEESILMEEYIQKSLAEMGVKNKIASKTAEGIKAAIDGEDQKWFLCLTKDRRTCDRIPFHSEEESK